MKGSSYINEKSDVYSFGILFWCLFTQKQPFYNLTNGEDIVNFVTSGGRPKLPKGFPKTCELIEKCWDADSTKRPNFIRVSKILFITLLKIKI